VRIVVAMSGGVDSSVAAALLAEQGHDVIGLSMQLYDQAEGQSSFGSCCSIDGLNDARRVAAAINIPHYVLNFERQFHEQVVSNFVNEYIAGRTPLPCARCNGDLKFATLAERAESFGADAVATGHYARVELLSEDEVGSKATRYVLKRGLDASKDQSYFLFSLTQAQLARAVFPVGDRPKTAVRAYARLRNLPVADKPDSQEICFIPDHDYRGFVEKQRPDTRRTGQFVDEHGAVVAPGDVTAQAERVMANLVTALDAAGATLADVARSTVYVASADRSDLVAAWDVVRAAFGDHDAPSTLLGVAVLGYPDQLVEVEAVAVLPD